ncbi:MAG: UDP-N-acetylmuramate--L-alanine ligase [Deltaproteobacteria bacterium]|nr:UDP-N-acetylmuramate--L-alanine ligase [Deltaproteobacteria bacterium]
MYKRRQNIHFVGIGGIGMSGIAELLHNLDYVVTGSDLAESETVTRLRSLGCTIEIGHRAENLADPYVVVISSAVHQGNPEVVEARRRGIPVIPRAEMLAELMRMKYGVAIAGTHGKTTTTSIVAQLLAAGELDPTVVIGGKVNSLGTNAKLGQGEYLVAEADESDGSFLRLSPAIAIVTNIDPEHLDYYRDLEHLQETFLTFVNKVPFYGMVVLCLDEPNVQALIPRVEKRMVTYGMSSQADFHATDLRQRGFTSEFGVRGFGKDLGRFRLHMPGRHNVSNALAAIATALELQIPVDRVREGLEAFSGIERRFQVKLETPDLLLIDDYGHHPAEIRATLAAAREGFDRRTVVVFQPHRYTRTRDLLEEFYKVFNQADVLILTEIYAAGEEKIPGISARLLYEGIRAHGHRDVRLVAEKAKIPELLESLRKPGDLVITMGAGDVWRVGEVFRQRITGEGE